MHLSSYRHMERLVHKYLDSAGTLTVYDIGSQDVNGSYRPLFDPPGWQYHGVDLAAGPNVDFVCPSPYRLPIASNSADLIISGQAFEHVEFFWLSWLEIVRALKPCGMIFLIAPSRGPEHRYPVDCWRFYPDGYAALAKYANLELLEVRTDWDPDPDLESRAWGDTVGVFRKPYSTVWRSLRNRLFYSIQRALLPT